MAASLRKINIKWFTNISRVLHHLQNLVDQSENENTCHHFRICIITYSINIFPDTVHFSPCDTEILSDDTGGEREKQS